MNTKSYQILGNSLKLAGQKAYLVATESSIVGSTTRATGILPLSQQPYFHAQNTKEYLQGMSANQSKRSIYHAGDAILPVGSAFGNQGTNLTKAMSFSQQGIDPRDNTGVIANAESTEDYLYNLQKSTLLAPNYSINITSDTKELITQLEKKITELKTSETTKENAKSIEFIKKLNESKIQLEQMLDNLEKTNKWGTSVSLVMSGLNLETINAAKRTLQEAEQLALVVEKNDVQRLNENIDEIPQYSESAPILSNEENNLALADHNKPENEFSIKDSSVQGDTMQSLIKGIELIVTKMQNIKPSTHDEIPNIQIDDKLMFSSPDENYQATEEQQKSLITKITRLGKEIEKFNQSSVSTSDEDLIKKLRASSIILSAQQKRLAYILTQPQMSPSRIIARIELTVQEMNRTINELNQTITVEQPESLANNDDQGKSSPDNTTKAEEVLNELVNNDTALSWANIDRSNVVPINDKITINSVQVNNELMVANNQLLDKSITQLFTQLIKRIDDSFSEHSKPENHQEILRELQASTLTRKIEILPVLIKQFNEIIANKLEHSSESESESDKVLISDLYKQINQTSYQNEALQRERDNQKDKATINELKLFESAKKAKLESDGIISQQQYEIDHQKNKPEELRTSLLTQAQSQLEENARSMEERIKKIQEKHERETKDLTTQLSQENKKLSHKLEELGKDNSDVQRKRDFWIKAYDDISVLNDSLGKELKNNADRSEKLAQKNKQLIIENKDLNSKLTLLEKRKNELEEKANNLQDELIVNMIKTSSYQELNVLQELKLNENQENEERLNEKIVKLKKELNQERNKSNVDQTKIGLLQDELQASKMMLEEAKSYYDLALNGIREDVRNKQKAQLEEISLLEAKLATASELKTPDNEKELAKLREQLDEAKNKIKSLEAGTLYQGLVKSREELDDVKAKLAGLERIQEDFYDVLNKHGTLNGQTISEFLDRYETELSQIEELTNEVEKLSAENTKLLEEKKVLVSENKSLTEQVTDLSVEIQKSKEVLSEITESYNQSISSIASKNQKIKEAIESSRILTEQMTLLQSQQKLELSNVQKQDEKARKVLVETHQKEMNAKQVELENITNNIRLLEKKNKINIEKLDASQNKLLTVESKLKEQLGLNELLTNNIKETNILTSKEKLDLESQLANQVVLVTNEKVLADELRLQLTNLTEKQEKLSEELNEARKRNLDLVGQVKDLELAVADGKRELEQANTQLLEVGRRADSAERNVAELGQEVIKQQDASKILTTRMERLTLDYEQATKAAQGNADALQQATTDYERDKAQLEQRLELSRNAELLLGDKLGGAEQKLEQANNSVALLTGKLRNLQKTNLTLKERIKQADVELPQLKTALEEQRKLATTYSEQTNGLTKKLNDTATQNRWLQGQVSQLENKNNELLSQVKDLELAVADGQIKLEQANTQLVEVGRRADSAQRNVAELGLQVIKQQEESKILTTRMENLTLQYDKATKAAQGNEAALQQATTDYERDKAQLEQSLELSRNAELLLGDKLSGAEQKLEQANNSVALLTDKLRNLQKTNLTLKERIKQADVELPQLKTALEEQRKLATTYSEQTNGLTKKLNDTATQNRWLQGQVSQLENKNNELLSQVNTMAIEISKKDQIIYDLAQKLSLLKTLMANNLNPAFNPSIQAQLDELKTIMNQLLAKQNQSSDLSKNNIHSIISEKKAQRAKILEGLIQVMVNANYILSQSEDLTAVELAKKINSEQIYIAQLCNDWVDSDGVGSEENATFEENKARFNSIIQTLEQFKNLKLNQHQAGSSDPYPPGQRKARSYDVRVRPTQRRNGLNKRYHDAQSQKGGSHVKIFTQNDGALANVANSTRARAKKKNKSRRRIKSSRPLNRLHRHTVNGASSSTLDRTNDFTYEVIKKTKFEKEKKQSGLNESRTNTGTDDPVFNRYGINEDEVLFVKKEYRDAKNNLISTARLTQDQSGKIEDWSNVTDPVKNQEIAFEMAKMILVNYQQGDQVSISGSDQTQIELVCEAVTRLRDSLFINYRFEDLGSPSIPRSLKPSTYYLQDNQLFFVDHTGTKSVEHSISNQQYDLLKQLFDTEKSNSDAIYETLKQITVLVPNCMVPRQDLIEMKVTPKIETTSQIIVDSKLVQKARDFKNKFLEQRRLAEPPRPPSTDTELHNNGKRSINRIF